MAYTTITDPSAQFQIALYSGDGGGSNAITNDGNSNLQPDFVWVKERSSNSSHALANSTAGAGYILSSNNSNLQSSASAFSSFNSDGFTVGSDGKTNEVNQTYVGWQWKANGGTTVSNTDGTITSTVQANTTAGFSVITYTGTGSNGTIGHGLNSAPEYWVVKPLTNVSDNQWFVCHKGINDGASNYADYFIHWDTDGAKQDNALMWNDTVPTNSVISLGSKPGTNNNGGSFVCFAWHSVEGYSKFGSYTGNGSADGAFVYTGFKPAYIMVKRTDSTGAWNIQDLKRSPFNVQDNFIQANDEDPEAVFGSGGLWDSLSNGFKLRQNLTTTNALNGKFMYMAFAQNPFVATNGVPTTAM
jgi:hypothetical protein